MLRSYKSTQIRSLRIGSFPSGVSAPLSRKLQCFDCLATKKRFAALAFVLRFGRIVFIYSFVDSSILITLTYATFFVGFIAPRRPRLAPGV